MYPLKNKDDEIKKNAFPSFLLSENSFCLSKAKNTDVARVSQKKKSKRSKSRPEDKTKGVMHDAKECGEEVRYQFVGRSRC